MSQTRKGSFIESCVNIAIGFSVNWTANMLVLPLFGFSTLTGEKAFGIGCIFTVISLVRSFCLRRFFNSIKWGNR